MSKRLVVAIHDLHPWGGQDKSNLEILYHLNTRIPMDIHAYQFIDSRPWPQVNFIKYTGLRRPLMLKSISFAVRTFFYFFSKYRKTENFIQSTGTATLDPDIFQIQFLHKTWRSLQNNYDLEEDSNLLKSLYHQFLQTFNIFIENIIYKKNKRYIAISHSIKKELIEYFQIPAKNITTIYHGVDTDVFCPPTSLEAQNIRKKIRQELRIPDDAFVLLHTGALNQRKGVPCAIETLGFLASQGFDHLHYIAVGAGDTRPLKKLTDLHKISDRVHFVQHSKNIRDYYWASDLFFFPTVYEPFGLVILEAMACGLACAVSPSAGASELIENKLNGVLLENILDPESMAHQLSDIIKNPSYLKSLSTHAVATAKENTWIKVADEYWSHLQSMGVS